ncbi:MAG TPA: hypothetical protein DEQ38_02070 [Elusimicrobia bacterium]|nr:MAG: hypothetical protein A2089_07395 [Elusimicrobia bacterium GWD2_63_28]HCC46895.1 hypothetical protein [Elusimicrobiota bacterium]
MKTTLFALTLLMLSAPQAKAQDKSVLELFGITSAQEAGAIAVPVFSDPVPARQTDLARKYAHLDPKGQVPADLLATALAYYDANLKKIHNPYFLSVVDFSQFAGKRRFFIIDMRTGEVRALLVSHGAGSDPGNTGFATLFSDAPRSKQSSLGFYRTGEVYYGAFGLSMRLDGLSATNHRARSRAVVLHAYKPVTETYAGPSWGCLGVSPSVIAELTKDLKHGSIIYAGFSGSAAPYSKGGLDIF